MVRNKKTTDATASLLWKKMRSRWRHIGTIWSSVDNVVGGSGGSIGETRSRSVRSVTLSSLQFEYVD